MRKAVCDSRLSNLRSPVSCPCWVRAAARSSDSAWPALTLMEPPGYASASFQKSAARSARRFQLEISVKRTWLGLEIQSTTSKAKGPETQDTGCPLAKDGLSARHRAHTFREIQRAICRQCLYGWKHSHLNAQPVHPDASILEDTKCAS